MTGKSRFLNYTTSVDPHKSIAEIQRRLLGHGAGTITVLYNAARAPESVEFTVATEFGVRRFRLPGNLPGVEAALARQAKAGKIPRRFATAEQAARVAWRVAKDWVEVELARVESGVAIDEVLCAYMVNADDVLMIEAYRSQQRAIADERGPRR